MTVWKSLMHVVSLSAGRQQGGQAQFQTHISRIIICPIPISQLITNAVSCSICHQSKKLCHQVVWFMLTGSLEPGDNKMADFLFYLETRSRYRDSYKLYPLVVFTCHNIVQGQGQMHLFIQYWIYYKHLNTYTCILVVTRNCLSWYFENAQASGGKIPTAFEVEFNH